VQVRRVAPMDEEYLRAVEGTMGAWASPSEAMLKKRQGRFICQQRPLIDVKETIISPRGRVSNILLLPINNQRGFIITRRRFI